MLKLSEIFEAKVKEYGELVDPSTEVMKEFFSQDGVSAKDFVMAYRVRSEELDEPVIKKINLNTLFSFHVKALELIGNTPNHMLSEVNFDIVEPGTDAGTVISRMGTSVTFSVGKESELGVTLQYDEVKGIRFRENSSLLSDFIYRISPSSYADGWIEKGFDLGGSTWAGGFVEGIEILKTGSDFQNSIFTSQDFDGTPTERKIRNASRELFSGARKELGIGDDVEHSSQWAVKRINDEMENLDFHSRRLNIVWKKMAKEIIEAGIRSMLNPVLDFTLEMSDIHPLSATGDYIHVPSGIVGSTPAHSTVVNPTYWGRYGLKIGSFASMNKTGDKTLKFTVYAELEDLIVFVLQFIEDTEKGSVVGALSRMILGANQMFIFNDEYRSVAYAGDILVKELASQVPALGADPSNGFTYDLSKIGREDITYTVFQPSVGVKKGYENQEHELRMYSRSLNRLLLIGLEATDESERAKKRIWRESLMDSDGLGRAIEGLSYEACEKLASKRDKRIIGAQGYISNKGLAVVGEEDFGVVTIPVSKFPVRVAIDKEVGAESYLLSEFMNGTGDILPEITGSENGEYGTMLRSLSRNSGQSAWHALGRAAMEMRTGMTQEDGSGDEEE